MGIWDNKAVSVRNTVQHTQTPLALSLPKTEQILAPLLKIYILYSCVLYEEYINSLCMYLNVYVVKSSVVTGYMWPQLPTNDTKV